MMKRNPGEEIVGEKEKFLYSKVVKNIIVKNKSIEELKTSIIVDKQNAQVIYFPYNSILSKNFKNLQVNKIIHWEILSFKTLI